MQCHAHIEGGLAPTSPEHLFPQAYENAGSDTLAPAPVRLASLQRE